jgi:hypothetical protein
MGKREDDSGFRTADDELSALAPARDFEDAEGLQLIEEFASGEGLNFFDIGRRRGLD